MSTYIVDWLPIAARRVRFSDLVNRGSGYRSDVLDVTSGQHARCMRSLMSNEKMCMHMSVQQHVLGCRRLPACEPVCRLGLFRLVSVGCRVSVLVSVVGLVLVSSVPQ